MGFRFYFTPLPRFFSPFPHGTSSLSVADEYLALGGGPPEFPRDFSCPMVLGYPFERDCSSFAYRTIAVYGSPFPGDSARVQFCNSPTLDALGSDRAPRHRPHNACMLVNAARFRLFPVRSPLLRKSRFLSLPEATKMVQFASLARRNYVFISSCCGFTATGSPIRKSPDQQLFAPSRSLSQLAASFVAYRRQGIHHTPLLT